MSTITQTQIVNHMTRIVKDHIDSRTGEVNATTLGETTIAHYNLTDDQIEELDVFFLSYQVAKRYEAEHAEL